MAIGNQVQLDFHQENDPDTGVEITRLTPLDAICHRPYFYQKCFTNDGSHLLFAGNFDGHWNYYLLELNQQIARQLTEGDGDNSFGGFLTTDETALFYVKYNRQLMRVELKDGSHKTMYEVPDGWVGYGTWVPNSECTKVVGIEIDERDYMPLTDWEKFAEQYHRKPHCRLISIDLATGERSVISDQQTWLGHPIYRPFDDNTVAFCHEGPHDLVETRMWMVDEDGQNMRKVHDQEPGESCTHEFWVPDGSRMIFVSYLRGESDRWICSVDPAGTQSVREMKMPPCSHIMSNSDGSLLVGDGSDTPVDVADTNGHEHTSDPYLYILDLNTKKSRKLCRHDTSWDVLEGSRQINHPHPSFTPDESHVLFGSDKDGSPAIYLAKLN
ncbi:oligogalacturonate lyase family protein [Reinekea sp. G2M2-21]|uniref:oligogalacturonate lyase family protein n=1 Tax=Reinekea sp. G2M2-21 TaxID=2788942 RepID=UPI0018ABD275|nr:oligogalacturonate lyase family protein [Reinekea sp. G2M2-21]